MRLPSEEEKNKLAVVHVGEWGFGNNWGQKLGLDVSYFLVYLCEILK